MDKKEENGGEEYSSIKASSSNDFSRIFLSSCIFLGIVLNTFPSSEQKFKF